MSNGDKQYKHMVVCRMPVTDDGVPADVLCFTEGGQPAVYGDTPPAELRCSQLREQNPHVTFRVVSFQVL